MTPDTPAARKSGHVLVKQHNMAALREVFDLRYIPTIRIGDQLPVPDRARLAVCLRYWRKLSNAPSSRSAP